MITLTDVVRRVREIADAAPGSVYKPPRGGPVYLEMHNGRLCGSCGVGRALVDLGVDPELIRSVDHLRHGYRASYLLAQLADAGAVEKWCTSKPENIEIRLAEPRLLWLGVFQQQQDSGSPLGYAVLLADTEEPLT